MTDPTQPPSWDEAPTPSHIDLTHVSREEMTEELRKVLTPAEAAELVTGLRGSASDYERNIAVLRNTIDALQVAGRFAVRILGVV